MDSSLWQGAEKGSGHNALDVILAYCLGRAVQRCLGSQFYIVSKDKDFEPMIAHLSGQGISVVRCDSFTALPFLPKPTKPHPVRAVVPAKSNPPFKAVLPVKAGAQDARLEKLSTRLKNNSPLGPRTKPRLLAHINTAFGGRLTEAEQNEKLAELIRRGVLTIDAKGKVRYA